MPDRRGKARRSHKGDAHSAGALVPVGHGGLGKRAPAKRRHGAVALRKRTLRPVYREEVERITKELMPLIRKDEDFALILDKKRGKYSIEPTRDLTLLLTDYYKLNWDASIERVDETDREIFYTVKAVVTDQQGNKATGLGMASTRETFTTGRERHDALTKAETRAIKRGIEARAGFPIINKLILHVYGGYQLDRDMRPIKDATIEGNGVEPQPAAAAAPTPAPVRPAALPDSWLVTLSDTLAKMPWLKPQQLRQYQEQGKLYVQRKDLNSMRGMLQALTKQIAYHTQKGQ